MLAPSSRRVSRGFVRALVLDRMVEVFEELTGLEIAATARLDELGASIDLAEIVSASAADLGVDVDADVLDRVGTLGELVDHLHQRAAV